MVFLVSEHLHSQLSLALLDLLPGLLQSPQPLKFMLDSELILLFLELFLSADPLEATDSRLRLDFVTRRDFNLASSSLLIPYINTIRCEYIPS